MNGKKKNSYQRFLSEADRRLKTNISNIDTDECLRRVANLRLRS